MKLSVLDMTAIPGEFCSTKHCRTGNAKAAPSRYTANSRPEFILSSLEFRIKELWATVIQLSTSHYQGTVMIKATSLNNGKFT